MTRRVGLSEQGQLQGALSSLRGIAFMVGPVLFTKTFARFIEPHRNSNWSGAPYLLAAGLVTVATILAAYVTRPQIRRVIDSTTDESDESIEGQSLETST